MNYFMIIAAFILVVDLGYSQSSQELHKTMLSEQMEILSKLPLLFEPATKYQYGLSIDLFPIEGAKTYFSGGGGLTSTVSDYSRFTQMLLNHGELDGVKLISRKTVELITIPKIDVDNDKIPDISIGGFHVFHDIVKMGELIGSEGAYTGGGAFYGSYLIDPKENLSVVFMSQVLPAKTDISERVAVMIYQALK